MRFPLRTFIATAGTATVIAAAAITTGCVKPSTGSQTTGAQSTESQAAAPAADQIAESLFLLGDAGKPDGAAVVGAIGRLARTTDLSKSLVVFLGDNIYEAGVPQKGTPAYTREAHMIQEQLDSLPAPLRAVYVPGNHDWGNQRSGDPETIRRESELIRSIDSVRFHVFPADGCPGPTPYDVGSRLRILALDTQWQLHHIDSTTSACTAHSQSDVVTQLRTWLAAGAKDGRTTVVVTHHPLMSGGAHGQHSGDQDVGGAAYQQMIAAFTDAFSANPPLVYAGGHDHSLQVLRGQTVPYVLVSGAGAQSKLASTKTLPNTLYALQDHPGFMRIDALKDGRIVLRVYTVDGLDTPVYTRELSGITRTR